MGQILLILDRRKKPLGDPITERTVDPEELRVKGCRDNSVLDGVPGAANSGYKQAHSLG
jgi:hypothetical protein